MVKKKIKKLKSIIRKSPFFLPLYNRYVFISVSLFLVKNSVPLSGIYAATRENHLAHLDDASKNCGNKGLINLFIRYLDLIKSRNEKYRNKCAKRIHRIGNHTIGKGCLNLATEYYKIAIELHKPNTERYIRSLTGIASTKFLLGELEEAKKYFKKVTLSKRYIRNQSSESEWFKVLGGTWTPAIGHLCMIDFYLKQFALGISNFRKPEKIVVSGRKDRMPNKYLVKKHEDLGVAFVSFKNKYPLNEYYDSIKPNNKKSYSELTKVETSCIVEEFWEYDFGGDECYMYTHGAAVIQKEWERQKRSPLYMLDQKEHKDLKKLLQNMGVPDDVWYVCLHVRESGFHKKWNTMYPSARDAIIDTYTLAIEEIAKRGGWVIRMGDSSMKPMPRMQNFIDYCHSDFKSDKADILLSAGCKFFIGTNSGFATVPGIFGVPNVLTNWVPISLPLWFGQDLMIPKLFHDKSSNQYLSIEDMLKTKLGSIQNVNEFPENIEIIDNSAEDIADAVIEMIERLEGSFSNCQEDAILQNKYEQICMQNGSYKGSNLGYGFAHKYNLI